MKIGIIGNGVVGSATAAAFREHVEEVRCYDRDPARRTHGLTEVATLDLVFICLPTPQCTHSLACDISAIDSLCATLSEGPREGNFVLRSTVPVGTTRMLREEYGLINLVHSPEFLTARTAEHDACNPTRMIIGEPPMKDMMGLGYTITPRPWTKCGELLRDLYTKAFHQVIDSPIVPDYDVEIFWMTPDESEAVKYYQNVFSAIKIAAFNEFYRFAKLKGLNWDRCLEALLAGGWINPMHTQVPGPDGKFGFGGACLPKDLASFIAQLPNTYMLDDESEPTCISVARAAYDRNRHVERKDEQ